MNRPVVLTQRSIPVEHRGEVGDYLDRRWVELLSALSQQPLLMLPNHVTAARTCLSKQRPALIILTGGNNLNLPGAGDTSEARDEVESWLCAQAEADAIPVLGVCRGAQFLAARAGAMPVQAPGHAGRTHLVEVVTDPGWGWPASFRVTSHHNWVLPASALPQRLDVIAVADDKTVEAFGHRELPQWGLMWHPEREQPGGSGQNALRSILAGQQ
jgi:Predicted glutamine amidotransferases